MRRIQFVLVTTILIASVSVLAQNRITQGLTYSCIDEYNNFSYIGISKFVWCDENQGDLNYTISIKRNDQQIYLRQLTNIKCDLLGNNVRRCYAPVPVGYEFNANNIPSDTTLIVSDGALSVTSAVMQTPLRTCRYFLPGVPYTDVSKAETRPVDTSIGGQMSGTIQQVAERIGQMRRDGWRVEWQWDSEDDRVVVMMWCLGIPQ